MIYCLRNYWMFVAIIDHNDGIGSKERILCGPTGAVGNQTSSQSVPLEAGSGQRRRDAIVRDTDNLLLHGNTLCLREEAGGGKLPR